MERLGTSDMNGDAARVAASEPGEANEFNRLWLIRK